MNPQAPFIKSALSPQLKELARLARLAQPFSTTANRVRGAATYPGKWQAQVAKFVKAIPENARQGVSDSSLTAEALRRVGLHRQLPANMQNQVNANTPSFFSRLFKGNPAGEVIDSASAAAKSKTPDAVDSLGESLIQAVIGKRQNPVKLLDSQLYKSLGTTGNLPMTSADMRKHLRSITERRAFRHDWNKALGIMGNALDMSYKKFNP